MLLTIIAIMTTAIAKADTIDVKIKGVYWLNVTQD